MTERMEVKREENVWENIVKNSLDLIGTIDQHGYYVNINEAFRHVLGYEKDEMLGKHFSSFLHPDDLPLSSKIAADILKGSKVSNFENRGIHKNGQVVHVLWSAVWSEEDKMIVCVGRDVSAQRLARRKEELQKFLVEYGVDTLAVFDEKLNYLYSGGSIFKKMGYLPEQLVGTNASDYVHPDDVPVVKEALSKALNSEKHFIIPALRFRNAQGEWRWVETTVSNQLHNPDVRALVTTSRDITERVIDKLKLQESEQRFKSLFENHLDIVLYQNRDGIIVDVNTTTLSFFGGIPKEAIINRPFTDFLTPELAPICTKALQSAMRGEWVRYELTIPFEGLGTFTFDISKLPVIVDGEVIGSYSILRDVTKIHHSNETIRQQASKLNNILESITDAFFTLDKNWNFTYVNKELERLFSIDRQELLGKNFWMLADSSIKEELSRQYRGAVETGKSAHFETYLKQYEIWLQVKAFPSDEGLSVFMDNITEKVKSRKELERLSLVASKTTNGVVITDAAGLIEWVNEGFTCLTGYTLPEVVGRRPASFLVGEETDKEDLERFMEKRLQGKPFHQELLNYKKSGEKIWILLDVSPVLNEAGEVSRYVTIQTDITERKEAEVSQLRLTKDLYRQNQDLQQFTYIVSHNLRSPVANALGLVDVLSMVEKESDTFEVSLGYLKKSVNQLDTVLKDLNMILSIRDKRDNIEQQHIQLVLICRQAIDDLKESLQACGGQVQLEISDSLYVHADKAYLYSVFYNLLSNAIKYRSPKRALKVTIKCYTSSEGGTLVTVSDNGSGFDMQLAGDKVFKLYKRFHSSSDGRGIGLYLVKAHLQAMGGHIEVTSQVNVGTRFLIYLR